jgi:predicted DNA-binding protein (UPF0251 family)
MTSFANLIMVGRVSTPNAATKPKQYDFGIHTEKQLNDFCRQYQLTQEENLLLRLTEVQEYPFNQIANTLGTSRQNVFQKWKGIYKKTIGK